MRKFLSAAAEREAEGREAEQEAEGGEAEGEERYHNLFMNALNGIYQTTPEGRLVNANPEFARILGFNSPEDEASCRCGAPAICLFTRSFGST